MKPKLTFRKIFGHLHTILTHKKWVLYYCYLCGITWRGIKHDMSKFSPTEFFESARYWTGTTSPITEAKKINGFSRAWLHHRGRNTHHWAHWTDNYSEGTITYVMPLKDFTEMVCDFLAAGRAYSKEKFTYKDEYKWWLKDKELGNKAMNIKNKNMLDIIFSDLAAAEEYSYSRNHRDYLTPTELLKTNYIEEVYRANL